MISETGRIQLLFLQGLSGLGYFFDHVWKDTVIVINRNAAGADIVIICLQVQLSRFNPFVGQNHRSWDYPIVEQHLASQAWWPCLLPSSPDIWDRYNWRWRRFERSILRYKEDLSYIRPVFWSQHSLRNWSAHKRSHFFTFRTWTAYSTADTTEGCVSGSSSLGTILAIFLIWKISPAFAWKSVSASTLESEQPINRVWGACLPSTPDKILIEFVFQFFEFFDLFFKSIFTFLSKFCREILNDNLFCLQKLLGSSC